MNVGKNWGRDNPIPLLPTLWLNSDSWSVECLPFLKKTNREIGQLHQMLSGESCILITYITARAVSGEWSQSLGRRQQTYSKLGYRCCWWPSPLFGPPWPGAWPQSVCGRYIGPELWFCFGSRRKVSLWLFSSFTWRMWWGPWKNSSQTRVTLLGDWLTSRWCWPHVFSLTGIPAFPGLNT